MKLMLLYITAASAVTFYPDEDSMATETQTRYRHENIRSVQEREHHADENQPAAYTVRQRHVYGELPEHTRQQRGEDETSKVRQQRGEAAFRLHREQLRQQRENKDAVAAKYRQQRVQDVNFHEAKQRPSQQQQQSSGSPVYFSNIHEDRKLGYSSYVQHQGEDADANQEGSMEIKKLVPKSSVQVEMYHEPDPQQQRYHQQLQQKEASQAKLKNKPPKFFHDALASYKHGKPAEVFPSSAPSAVMKDLTPTSSPYLTPSAPPKYRATPPSPYRGAPPTPSKRRPYSARQEHHGSQNAIQDEAAINHKPESSSYSHKPESSSYSHKPESSSYSHSESVSHSHNPPPVVHVRTQSHSHSSILESKNPRWKSLSESVEIAASDEFQPKPKPKRSRKPKEISESSVASHVQYFGSEPERYKAERFDHEKALKASTPFGISHVVFGNNFPEFQKSEKDSPLNGGSFHVANSVDIAKAVDAQISGTSKGPVQFNSAEEKPKPTKQPTYNSGNFEIPVMSEEEFEKNFGKFREQATKKPDFRFKPGNRLAFDARNHPQHVLAKHPAMSFSQFNGGLPSWAQTQHSPVYKIPQQPKTHGSNVDLFPSLGFSASSRRNISIVPERHGRVFNDDAAEPQQFSVSASYQIDRNHRGL